MLKKLERYLVDLIQGKKQGALAFIAKTLLRFLSWIYQLIIAGRNWAFDQGCCKQYHAPVPVVISIGNIVVGGTGKTPVTLMVAQAFSNDFTIAILSRGYRSKAEHLPLPVILSYGNGPVHPAAYCGDEPYLLAQNLPKAHIIVGKNRQQSSRMAVRAGAQLILLDDGMQHRKLARDYEIVVINALDPFGQGYFLPRGFLREAVSSLSRADLIVLNHLQDKEQLQLIAKEIRKFSEAPLIATKMEVAEVLDLQGQPLAELVGKKVGIFCAIAHPDYFYQTVKQLGAEPVDTEFMLDHLTFTTESLIQFCERAKAKGAEWILCTEKDRVKLDELALAGQPIGWLKMTLRIVEGKIHWEGFIEKTKHYIKRRI
ncbi:Tetraacyldisaccharide 4'-kinase|uniref:tetraacyldisaccharide 4'-kinase n=1 Tax=Neochlamydia sp. AcF84 TaxID=2315858 RepID=UPI00140AEED2|nr:tetraacyldisaccharide 4'-kinase [Neochlamydia sp. AcF84]NGY94418.1 Tetraacyldisaccharide 4'-kinase [Neochlamydia sp. AcF84]